MRPRIALATLALLTGCAAPAAKIAGEPADLPIAAVPATPADLAALPDTLAGMIRQGPPQPDPAPGTTGAVQRYAGQAGVATVYLYTRDGIPVPEGADSPVATRELVLATLAASAIHAAAATGDKPPPAPAWRSFMIQVGGVTPLRCAHSAAAMRDRPIDDFVCVTGLGSRLLKLRLTLTRQPGQEGRAAGQVGEFAAGVLNRLPGAGTSAAPPPAIQAPEALPERRPRPPAGPAPRGNLLRT